MITPTRGLISEEASEVVIDSRSDAGVRRKLGLER